MKRGNKVRLPLLLVACLCAVLAMSASAAAADKTEIPVADGVAIPPNVDSVIVISGSDYDMGYQYVQQYVQVFGTEMLKNLQRTFAEEQVLALKAYQWYLKQFAPEYIEQFKGMAQAATDADVPLSYAEVMANYCVAFRGGSPAVYPGTEPEGSGDETLPPSGGCTGFAAWGGTTRSGELICAGSSDAEPGFGYLLVAYPETGNDYILAVHTVSNQWGLRRGTIHPAMNNKGLCFAHHGAGVHGNEQDGYCVPPMLMSEHTLRFADNSKQALKMQLAYPHGSTYNRGLWADTSGDAFDIECRDPKTVRRPGDNGERDFIYATNNCLTDKLTITKDDAWLADVFDWDLTFVPHGGWTAMDEDAVRRNLLIWNMLDNYRGKVDLEFVKMMWRFPGRLPDYPSLEEADEGMYANQSAGWDSKICALGNAVVGVCLPDNGDQGVFYDCVGPASAQANGQCPSYSYFIPDATHTFFQVKLAADPKAAVGAAYDRAMYDLSYANIELRKLTYADTAFVPLKEVFDRAVTEWYKARHSQDLAGKTTGNEAVCHWGKALRGFARCQAYANQVYEALVPAPDDPKDLGLKKYWGGWGDWESWLGSH